VHGALIEQVLVNILDNASRYSPAGTPIEFKVMLADPDLIIDIIDRGRHRRVGSGQDLQSVLHPSRSVTAAAAAPGLASPFPAL
jgi:K+-sensing histidine kinase KdpD